MTSLDSILKSKDITLPTKVHLVKAMVFPMVMYGCESWTVKKHPPRISSVLPQRRARTWGHPVTAPVSAPGDHTTELKASQKRRGYLLKRCFLGIQPINLVTPLAAHWTVPARPRMQLVAMEWVCIPPATQRTRDPPQQEGFL